MTEQNIVVVGASYSGILCAHYIAKHIVTNKQLGKLRLILISPSSEFFHTVGGPGAIIDGKRLPNEKVFYSLAEGFKQYPSSSYDIVKGTVTAVEISARNIQYSDSGTTKSVPFHGLILATGASATSPLFRAFPTTDDTRAAYKAFRDALPKARSIVIGGGGPVAVESAGEIGEFLNGTAGWFSSRPSSPKAKITLVTSSSKLLPILREDVASRAEKYLNRVGVDVVYNTKVAAVSPNNAGSTLETLVPRNGQKVEVQLHDGETLEADIYIPVRSCEANQNL